MFVGTAWNVFCTLLLIVASEEMRTGLFALILEILVFLVVLVNEFEYSKMPTIPIKWFGKCYDQLTAVIIAEGEGVYC